MDKIYSRFRIPRIIVTKSSSHKNKLLCILILVTIIAIFTARNIVNVINPLLERQSKSLARGTAIKLTNEASREAMQNITYQDLCSIEKDADGNIKMMKLDVSNVNKICSKISIDLQESLRDNNNNTFSIRLRKFNR